LPFAYLRVVTQSTDRGQKARPDPAVTLRTLANRPTKATGPYLPVSPLRRNHALGLTQTLPVHTREEQIGVNGGQIITKAVCIFSAGRPERGIDIVGVRTRK
jgi:hypothetical protein